MTEHSKSQPRVYDDLSSSHEIIHQADPTALAAGVVIVNIAGASCHQPGSSPANQYPSPGTSSHGRPPTSRICAGFHPIDRRSRRIRRVRIIVVECDNVGPANLWTDSPAPQPGDPDHYASFVSRLSLGLETRLAGTGD